MMIMHNNSTAAFLHSSRNKQKTTAAASYYVAKKYGHMSKILRMMTAILLMKCTISQPENCLSQSSACQIWSTTTATQPQLVFTFLYKQLRKHVSLQNIA